MTKVGEGKELPQEPSVQQYHKELEHNAAKFLNALESYQDADTQDKARLKVVMDHSLELIRASVKEIKRAGVYKQEVKVENDYKAYMSNNSEENLSTLEEDLSTLRDYNQLS